MKNDYYKALRLFYNHCNVAPEQALVLLLRSFKRGVKNKFLLLVIHIRCYSRYCDYKIRRLLRNHFMCYFFM